MRYYFLLVILMIMVSLTTNSALVAQEQAACKWVEKPVDDQTFKTFLDFFAYDNRLSFEQARTYGTGRTERLEGKETV